VDCISAKPITAFAKRLQKRRDISDGSYGYLCKMVSRDRSLRTGSASKVSAKARSWAWGMTEVSALALSGPSPDSFRGCGRYETSAKALEKLGATRVFRVRSPGMRGGAVFSRTLLAARIRSVLVLSGTKRAVGARRIAADPIQKRPAEDQANGSSAQ
jgi:hypothetical protein